LQAQTNARPERFRVQAFLHLEADQIGGYLRAELLLSLIWSTAYPGQARLHDYS
jgi:hypothetical protein